MNLFERLNHYRFETVWKVEGPRDRVFGVLRDLPRYPQWWREVQEVVGNGNSGLKVTIRATLPYSLAFDMQQDVVDELGGILKAAMKGDLEGFSRWRIVEKGGDCLLTFQEEVRMNKPLLRWLAPIARPIFKINHFLMMKHGQEGLRRYLEKMQ
ncbi:MAG: SRPBCC family protein [Actinomycetota bacterium]